MRIRLLLFVLPVVLVLALVAPPPEAKAVGGCEARTSLFSVPNLTFLGVVLCDTNGGQWVSLATSIKGEDFTNDLMKVAPQARAGGGATGKRQISLAANEDELAICTAACTLYSITATNINAAVRYIKCNNADASTTVPGTSVPEIDLAIPGATTGAGITFAFPVGMDFDTALTCWLVTGAAESDVAEVAANELKVLYTYKQ